MNVIVFASRKGGSGKSTLATHLAAHVHASGQRALLIDCDPQRSLTLWHRLRPASELVLRDGTQGIGDIVRAARHERFEWAFVDTPPNTSAVVTDAVHAATLVVIPARLTVFDLAAIRETMDLARALRKPYAVVINGVPARRDNTESPFVREARAALTELNVPIWSGQITNRAPYALALAEGQGVSEFDARSEAAIEIAALWAAIERSVGAINGAYEAAGTIHRVAA
jgi:chromosome partitioning protein